MNQLNLLLGVLLFFIGVLSLPTDSERTLMARNPLPATTLDRDRDNNGNTVRGLSIDYFFDEQSGFFHAVVRFTYRRDPSVVSANAEAGQMGAHFRQEVWGIAGREREMRRSRVAWDVLPFNNNPNANEIGVFGVVIAVRIPEVLVARFLAIVQVYFQMHYQDPTVRAGWENYAGFFPDWLRGQQPARSWFNFPPPTPKARKRHVEQPGEALRKRDGDCFAPKDFREQMITPDVAIEIGQTEINDCFVDQELQPEPGDE